jgi:hypothetical protein
VTASGEVPGASKSALRAVALVIGILAGVATIAGFVLHDVLDDGGSSTTSTPPSAGAEDEAAQDPTSFSLSALTQLSDDEQLNRFEAALGAPLRRKQLGEYTMTTWKSPDLAVVAYSDAMDEVLAYTVTVLTSDAHPIATPLPGNIHLGTSVFADVDLGVQSATGLYPPNGHYSYAERFYGAAATEYKDVVLAASWSAPAGDGEAAEIDALSDCLANNLFEQVYCPDARAATMRNGLTVTSFTVGERDDLEAIDAAGGQFFAEV